MKNYLLVKILILNILFISGFGWGKYENYQAYYEYKKYEYYNYEVNALMDNRINFALSGNTIWEGLTPNLCVDENLYAYYSLPYDLYIMHKNLEKFLAPTNICSSDKDRFEFESQKIEVIGEFPVIP